MRSPAVSTVHVDCRGISEGELQEKSPTSDKNYPFSASWPKIYPSMPVLYTPSFLKNNFSIVNKCRCFNTASSLLCYVTTLFTKPKNHNMGSPFIVARIFLSYHDTHAVAFFFILPDVMRLAVCELSPSRRWICERPQEAWLVGNEICKDRDNLLLGRYARRYCAHSISNPCRAHQA
jgi:hypothetical protein